MPMLETFQRGSVSCVAAALEHDLSVPFDPVRLKHPENRRGSSPNLARPVEIFHAYQPFAPVPARLEIAADRGDEGAEMQRTGRGGSKAPAIGSRRVMHNLGRKSYQRFAAARKSHDRFPSH